MKFILTKELGRLAKWLRILGFDTLYFNEGNAGSLIVQALRDDRVILTRNQRLPNARGVRLVHIAAETLKPQIKQITQEFNIKLDKQGLFTRCILCNEPLEEINKEEVRDKIPEYVYKTQKDFVRCPKCNRIYWQGTHWGNVEDTLHGIHC